MPSPDKSHSACVEDWMKLVANGLPAARLIQAFEQAFAALWRRAQQTLGDITLTAIVDRVLHYAAEAHPVLASLKVTEKGLSSRALRGKASRLPRARLASGIQFVLVEFLTVIGNLTAEIVTSSLHAELAKLSIDSTRSRTKPSMTSSATTSERRDARVGAPTDDQDE